MHLLAQLTLQSGSETPLYKQLAEHIRTAILSGTLARGERLPATRELAGQLGLNRTTVSAAYAVLEEAGLLQGSVGRGSFVTGEEPVEPAFDWNTLLGPAEPAISTASEAVINFASSRPAEDCFPLAAFRRLAREVIDSPGAADTLRLGSPYGYGPLRQYLMENERLAGRSSAADDLLVTSGCQQALDLIARVLAGSDVPVLLENPVYHGLLRVFGRTRAQVVGVAASESGINLQVLEALAAQHRPRLLVVTPDFQNPTGTTLPLEGRRALLALARRFGFVVVEIGIYRDLRYRGAALPTLKQLDEHGLVLSIGSYSKIAFPGLRIGWVSGARAAIARLAEAKQTSDLHSDQLSQAVLLRFAESGELGRHLQQTRALGLQRLTAALEACGRALPPGTRFTRPDGGMNLWIELPAPLAAEELLKAAEERGVTFLPGPYFAPARNGHRSGLRLSFGGLRPVEITRGIALLGAAAAEQLERLANVRLGAMAAIV